MRSLSGWSEREAEALAFDFVLCAVSVCSFERFARRFNSRQLRNGPNRHLVEMRVEFYPDTLIPKRLRCGNGRAASHKRVEDDAALHGKGTPDKLAEKFLRL